MQLKVLTPGVNPEQYYTKNEDTGENELTLEIYHHNVGYDGQNFYLARIPEATLQTKMTITGLKITLVDGQTIYDVPNTTIDANDPIKRLEHILAPIDYELVHGATIEIEYTITVHNTSAIQNSYLEILAHLPIGYSYISNTKILNENKLNENYGWEEVSLSKLSAEEYVSANTLEGFQNTRSILARLDEEGKLGSNQSCTLKFVASRIIGGFEALDPSPMAYAEVMVYRNTSNRRALKKDGLDTINNYTMQKLTSLYPADSKDIDYSGNTTNNVFIIPPTGLGLTSKLIIILLSSLMIITFISKKKMKNKS